MSSHRVLSPILFTLGTTLAACSASSDPAANEHSVASAEEVGASRRAISSEPDLVFLLDRLGKVAAGGSSLEAFRYTDNPTPPTKTHCVGKTSAEIADDFDGMVGTTMSDGDPGEAPDLTPEKIDAGKAAFRRLLGADDYRLCRQTIGGDATLSVFRYVTGPHVRVSFELSYED